MKRGVLVAASAVGVAGVWPCHAFQAATLGSGSALVGAAVRRGGAPALAPIFGCRIRNAAAPAALRPARPCGGRAARSADAGEGGKGNAKEAEVTMGAVLSRMGLVRLGILGAALFWLLLRVVDGVGILGAQLPGPLARGWRVQVPACQNVCTRILFAACCTCAHTCVRAARMSVAVGMRSEPSRQERQGTRGDRHPTHSGTAVCRDCFWRPEQSVSGRNLGKVQRLRAVVAPSTNLTQRRVLH